MSPIVESSLLPESYNLNLVFLSIIIAILASYAALDLAGRVTVAQSHLRRWWLLGGALAMGTGIWAMHFIGMLAFSLPVPVRYDIPTVVVSYLAAGFASGVALHVVSRQDLEVSSLYDWRCSYGVGHYSHALYWNGSDANFSHRPL